jgi:S1-C subfamily serine protease
MTNATMLGACSGPSPAIFSLLFFCSSAFAQEVSITRIAVPSSIESSGPPLINPSAGRFELNLSPEAPNDLLLSQIQKLSNERLGEKIGSDRSARDAELYRVTAPSVVMIQTNSSFGTGSLIGSSGEILTSLHVVKGQSQVAVIFKPATEGAIPTRDDLKLGLVIKYDEITDLALVRVTELPKGRTRFDWEI